MGMEQKIIVLFGAGLCGKNILEQGNIKNQFQDHSFVFCDNDIQKHDTTICGVRVISFETMKELYKSGKIEKIILTLSLEREILYQCIQAKIDINRLYYWDRKKNVERPVWEKYAEEVHSQDGEEIFLKEFFSKQDQGVYVDVGAYHPFRFSNTYWAYLRGWRGVNIEPDLINYELLKTFREDDKNINCGINDEETQMEYHMFHESGLNTFCMKEVADPKDVTKIRKVTVRRLDSILRELDIWKIDFMDIDVEGMELEVLNSINWDQVEIRCLLIEQKNMSLRDVLDSEVCKLLEDRGYVPVSKYNRTVIYIHSGEILDGCRKTGLNMQV